MVRLPLDLNLCTSQVIALQYCLQNYRDCVEFDVKHYSLTHLHTGMETRLAVTQWTVGFISQLLLSIIRNANISGLMIRMKSIQFIAPATGGF